MIDDISKHAPVPTVRELITKHARSIRVLIRNRCGRAVLEKTSFDDIYQDTIRAAIASEETFHYENDGGFLGWIAIIARRVISRKLNRSPDRIDASPIRRSASTGNGVRESELLSPKRSPSSSAAAHESSGALRDAIANLPDRYRKAMTLYRMEERPLAEVAKQLGLTKPGTCQLLARATKFLRKELEAYENDR